MPMDEEPDFYTQKGYQMRSDKLVTSAMEDYLEMICRQARMEGYARINFLAHRLNVRPSSASKMVYQLRELGLLASREAGESTFLVSGDGALFARCAQAFLGRDIAPQVRAVPPLPL